jgi:hypothetical protein
MAYRGSYPTSALSCRITGEELQGSVNRCDSYIRQLPIIKYARKSCTSPTTPRRCLGGKVCSHMCGDYLSNRYYGRLLFGSDTSIHVGFNDAQQGSFPAAGPATWEIIEHHQKLGDSKKATATCSLRKSLSNLLVDTEWEGEDWVQNFNEVLEMTLSRGYVSLSQIRMYLAACEVMVKNWAEFWQWATRTKGVGSLVDFVKLVRRSR